MAATRDDEQTLTARWVFPVAGPPLPRGTVTVAAGRIVAVEPHGARTPDVDLGNAAITPGFVNAHTHLDLSGLRGQVRPGDSFTDWLRTVIRYRRGCPPEKIEEDVRAGLAEALACGTTLLGDISGQGLSWAVLVQAPVRAVVYREVLGLSDERASTALQSLFDWLESHPATATCRPGVSPHAPYSVRSSVFFGASTMAAPVAVHLAETRDELDLLGDHYGPFVAFLRELGVWDPTGLAQSPEHVIDLLNGLSPTVLAHGNYLRPDAPVPAKASIVYCPRTHTAFGHPPHPFRAFLARGVRVALGTDSLASNPDLSLLAEARFLHPLAPDLPGETLLRMATLSGAEALGWGDDTGSLVPGKSADLAVLPLPDADLADPHSLLFASSLPVRSVLFGGRWVHGAVP